MRREFFGPDGDTSWNLQRLKSVTARFEHHALDIRDRAALLRLLSEIPADFVIHAALILGEHDMIMASDDPSGDGSGVKGCSLHLSFGDEAEARRVFEALAEGGRIDMPLEPTFWSPLFGACVDRFGVSWMIDATPDGTDGTG